MIPLYKVFMPKGIAKKLSKIIYSGKLSYGENSKLFEDKIQKFIGNSKILVTSTVNYAFQIAFGVLDLPVGSEVIAAPMSCLASVQPILTNKLVVKWVDIDPSTGTLNPDEVAKNITSNTKAILHNHWCGYPGYIDEINTIARNNGLYVIEDATDAFGARYKGNYIGNTNSDIVCFNFGPVRLPNTIDGGGIAFSSENLFKKALLMRDYGIDRTIFRDEFGEISPNCDIKIPGYGAMMNEISGYIGCIQMEYIIDLLNTHINNGVYYKKFFKVAPNVKILDWRDEITPSYWVYSILTNNRNIIMNKLRLNGIYSSAVHFRNDYYSCFRTNYGKPLKGTDYFVNTILSIPSGWWVNKVIRKKIIKVFEQNGN